MREYARQRALRNEVRRGVRGLARVRRPLVLGTVPDVGWGALWKPTDRLPLGARRGAEEYEPGRKLRLIAEMKLPGRAWLEFEMTPDGFASLVRQTAFFDPIGIAGLLYWYAIYPLHQLVFSGMLRGIAGAAERAGGGSLWTGDRFSC